MSSSHKPHPSVGEDLLLDQVWSHDQDSTCLVLGGSGAFIRSLPFTNVRWRPLDAREVDTNAEHVVVVDNVEPTGDTQLILFILPRDRDLARRLLLEAEGALADDGELHIVGSNGGGVKSILMDASELFGDAEGEDYKRKHRLGVFGKNGEMAPAWAAEPGIAPGTWDTFEVESGEDAFRMVWRAGVFPGPKVDAGTQLLLDQMPAVAGKSVLDVGCGGGVIGVMAARRAASAVTMLDPMVLACETARQNAHVLAPDAEVVLGDITSIPAGRTFDVILSNPPFHRGKQVDQDVATTLIARAPALLSPGGSLTVVANAFLPYDKSMIQWFADVDVIAETPQFRVIRAANPR